jgi:hypothetical protein
MCSRGGPFPFTTAMRVITWIFYNTTYSWSYTLITI